ncbi:MAG: putative phage tail protein [Lachnospiraceae bacterium]
MNLENFPTSESAKRMLESVDSGGFYDKSYVGKWIFQVMGLEMDEARQFIEELPYQAFPETATWGLRYHEQKYGLPVREGMPYEERRRNIYSKRDERSPMNPYRMEVILENITGRKAHVDDESGPVNTFTVKLESGDNVVDVAAAIKKLKEIKQSHVAFTLSFTSLARIEICGRTQKWKNQYTQCGTVPMVSTGLRITEAEVQIVPTAAGYKTVSPMAGNSGEVGQYPKTSTGLKVIDGAVVIEGNTESYLADYPETSENMETGTRPGTSTGVSESEKGVAPEVTTESYQVRYRLCGDTFEI